MFAGTSARHTPTEARRFQALLSGLLVTALGSCSLFVQDTWQAPADPGAASAPLPVRVEFQGGDELSEIRLIRTIEDRLYDLSAAPDSAGVLQDAEFDLEDRFRREGYADVEIRAWREDLPDSAGGRSVLAVFRIDAGPRHTVRELQLTGLDELAPGDPELDSTVTRESLLNLWSRQSSGLLGFGDPLFVASDLIGLADSMQLLLRSQGYLEARVDPPRFDRADPTSEGEAAMTVHIDLHPGPQYAVGDFELTGRAAAALPPWSRPLPPTDIATVRAIESWRTATLTAIQGRGHADATVRIALRRDVENAVVHATIDANPGPHARIEGLQISELENTDRDVVLDRLEFAVGEDYDRADIDASLRSLYLSGLFRRVEIDHVWLEPKAGATDDEVLPVRLDIDIEEEPSRSVEFLAGWGSYESARGKARFEEANLFGTGRGLIAEARVSTRGERGLLTLSDPRLFGTETVISLSADAYRREEPAFEDSAWGGTLALSRELRRHVTGRLGYTARLHTGTESDVGAGFSSEVDRYTEGSMFSELRYDDRDGIVYPRKGWLINLRVDTNQPELGATVDFWRARISAATYFELTDRLVLALRADSGALWPGQSSSRVPIQERFFNGGESTVRSFREAQLGPKDDDGSPIGGEYRNLFNVELRAGLTDTFEVSVFADAGNVGSRVDNFTFGDLSYGIGTGLRWALPIGPVRVDTAWNPDKQPGQREWTAHLSVGYPF